MQQQRIFDEELWLDLKSLELQAEELFAHQCSSCE
jgi:hypothetical protein